MTFSFSRLPGPRTMSDKVALFDTEQPIPGAPVLLRDLTGRLRAVARGICKFMCSIGNYQFYKSATQEGDSLPASPTATFRLWASDNTSAPFPAAGAQPPNCSAVQLLFQIGDVHAVCVV